MVFGHFLKQEKKKKIEKEKQNERIIKDRIIRDIRTLFKQEQQEKYYEPKRANKYYELIIIMSNMKVMMIKIETYHLMNILMKLKLT